MKLVVLISGNGSNLQAIIDACKSGFIPGSIAAVISNKPQAYGLQRATLAGIATTVVESSAYPDRESYDRALLNSIEHFQPDLVILAGFMRILSADFVRHYTGKLLNIHPSLLPLYPGLHTHRQAIANGDLEHGATVHFVTEELDGGPLILQGKVPVQPDDTETVLAERVHQIEHSLYPQVIRWYCQGHLKQDLNGHVWLKQSQLPLTGKLYTGPD